MSFFAFLVALTFPVSVFAFDSSGFVSSERPVADTFTSQFDLSERLHWNAKAPTPNISLFKWMVSQVDQTTASRKRPEDPSGQTPWPHPKYNRDYHFGGWVNEDSPRNCYDTRTEVLLRSADPRAPVVFDNNHCRVVKGGWIDPYSNAPFTVAATMDIDHVVPLQHAYDNGAWRWPAAVRCHYANFLANTYQLLAVSAHENRSKGSRDPTGYIPKYRPFVCTYLKIWLKVKMIWNLEIRQEEGSRVAELYKLANCDMRQQVMAQSELRETQAAAGDPSRACVTKMKGRTNEPPTLPSTVGF